MKPKKSLKKKNITEDVKEDVIIEKERCKICGKEPEEGLCPHCGCCPECCECGEFA